MRISFCILNRDKNVEPEHQVSGHARVIKKFSTKMPGVCMGAADVLMHLVMELEILIINDMVYLVYGPGEV
jgi:hypothetical protein